jgi:tetratricopeptide (TPR) repeat protein
MDRDSGDRISENSIRLVVPKRRPPSDSLAEIVDGYEDAATRAEAFLARLEQTTDPAHRARLLVEIAITLRDGLNDRGQAIDALLEAWRNDPHNDDILDHLEPLVRTEDRWNDVMEQTRTQVTVERDHRRALAYHEAMVRWLTRDVPDPDLARQWVERVRVLDPTHALVHFMQAALSREHGDFKREIDELDLAVLSTRRKDERCSLHLILASRYLEERTLNRVEAKKQYEQAHRLFPNMMDPLRGLEQLAQQSGENVELADVLRRQADADVEETERVEILLRLAKLEEEEFRRPELAAKTLERVVARAPKYDGVLEQLERCYRAARMWPELLGVLERAAIGDADAETRGQKLKRLGDVLESKLGDVKAALTTYQRLAGLMPEDETVVSELARLAEKTNDIPLAVNCRERLAELTQEPAMRARHNLIAGQLLTPIDAARARRYFERAVEADATNASAWNALLWDARAENDNARVARYLEARANGTETPRARAVAFVELAELHAKMGDEAAERSAWEQAISADPMNESAASKLLPVYLLQQRYMEAERLCTTIIEAAQRDKDPIRLYNVRRAQTEIGIALGKPDLALTAALAAHEARRDEPEGRKYLIRAAGDMRADPEVLKARDALVAIADKAEGLDVESRVILGEVLSLIGENLYAVALYEDALAEAGTNERALAGLSQQHAMSGNKVASLSLKKQMALGITDPPERLRVLLETGEAFAKIEEDALAAECYEAARQMRPGDLPLLHKLLGLYQKTSKWASLFDVLRSIAEVDTDPLRRAKTLFTMGQIAATELLDRGTALDLFDKTLDADASQLEAFERIARILTEAKDWAGLEQMYRKMIQRSEARRDDQLTHVLLKQLGLIYRDRLGDIQMAIHALQRAVQLREVDEEAQAMLRELLSSIGQASGAVQITLERVLKDPMDPRPYPALFDLLASQNQRDRALCVASAINFLDVNHPMAAGWRQSYPQAPIEGIVLDLGQDGYRQLIHPELDPVLTEIFAIVAPAVIDIAMSRLSLRERLNHPGPALKGQDWLIKVTSRAAHILGAPPPKLFARRTPGPALAIGATKPPSLLVYVQALAGVSRETLAFMIGRRVLELTPPLLARALCPAISELKALASSAARIATNQVEAGDQPLRERLKRDEIERISNAVHSSMQQGGKLDVLRWSQLADLSVSYGGLLLAGDLEAARLAMALEPQAPGDMSPRDKMRELVAWFLGDACANLRRRLGLALA